MIQTFGLMLCRLFTDLTVKNEWDKDEPKSNIRDRLIVEALYPGCGKSDYFKNAFKDDKDSILFVTPTNRLAYNFIEDGYRANTCHSLLKIDIDGKFNRRMKNLNLDNVRYICFDEIYCYNLNMLERIRKFMDEHPEIDCGSSGDYLQLRSPNCEVKEYRYIIDKCIHKMFPNRVILKDIKRIINNDLKKSSEQIALIHTLKAEIFDMSFEWNEARKRHILRHFETIALGDIRDRTICYTNYTADQININLNQINGGIKVNDWVTCCAKLELKKTKDISGEGFVTCQTNYEYKIRALETNIITLWEPLSENVFTISRAQFANHMKLSHCMTNHSSQGSSFDGPIVLADCLLPYADRNFVYVGLTRSRDMSLLKVCLNTQKDDLFVQNLSAKIAGHIVADNEAGRTFDMAEYVNYEWFVKQLKKQMFRCYNDECSCNLNISKYEAGCQQQYSIDRRDNDVAHTMSNCVISCLNCNVSGYVKK